MREEYGLIVAFGMLAILVYYMIRNIVSYYQFIPYFYRKRLKRKYNMTPERDKELETIVADLFLEQVDKTYLEGKITNDERYYLYEKYAKVWSIDDLIPRTKDKPPWDEVSVPEEPKRKSLQELFNQ